MNRRTRTNLRVAVALVGLLALAVWTYRGAERMGAPLLADPSAIGMVAIQGADGARVVFARTDEGWRMTAPDDRPVDAQRVDGIVNGFAIAPRRSYAADTATLADLGLDPPRWTITLDGAEFRLGDAHPVSGLRYVLHDGEIHLVDDLVTFRLGGDW